MENCLAMANNLRLFGNLASALNPNNLASLMEAATAAAAAAQRARTKFAAKNSADFVPVNNVQTMETWVLIPPELSLVLSTNPDENLSEKTNNNSATPARVWTRVALAGGRRLSPFQGTVRLGVMPSDPPCPEDDIRSSYGCYDEITQVHQRKVRHCNWVRFLRHVPVLTPEVNIVCSKVKGEPIYEVVRPIPAYTELVVFYLPGHPDEEFYLPAVRSLRSSLFRRTMGLILEDSPLDLSLALLSPKNNFETSAACPVLRHTSSTELTGRQSVSSESVTSSAGELDLDAPVVMVTGHGLSPHLHRHHPSPHHHHHHHHPAVSNNHHRPSRQRPLLPCQVCGKAFDRPSLLNRHMRTHTGEKPHVCEVCGKGFSTSSSLNTHRRIHSGEKPHECPVCGKRFTASSNLYYHRMTHIKEKPHKCALCSKSFPTPGDLKSHMYVHSGSWPFKCHVCNRGFSKHTNLKNHLFLHTGDKPHACELCNKRFALACNLRAHMKTHEGEPQEECLRCGKHFLLVNNTSSSSTATEDRYCPECCGSSPGADPDESKEDIDVVEDSISDPEPDPEIDIDIDEK